MFLTRVNDVITINISDTKIGVKFWCLFRYEKISIIIDSKDFYVNMIETSLIKYWASDIYCATWIRNPCILKWISFTINRNLATCSINRFYFKGQQSIVSMKKVS